MTNVLGVEITEDLISSSPSGIACYFVKIDSKWALKLFCDKEMRDICYQRQMKFADAGYGPEVRTHIDLDLEEVKYYGYITEILETCVPNEVDGSDSECRSRYKELQGIVAKFIEEYGSIRKPGTKVYNDLKEAFQATGIYLSDMHSYNLAWKNDKIVPIDFGNDGNTFTLAGVDYEDDSTHSG
jgi:hypothetical protein